MTPNRPFDLGALALVLGLSSALLAGCDDEGATGDWQVCVDAQGHRLPDGACRQGGGYYGAGIGRWAYLYHRGSVPAVGEFVDATTPRPAGGVNYSAAPEGGIARGGFGRGGFGFGHFGGFGE